MKYIFLILLFGCIHCRKKDDNGIAGGDLDNRNIPGYQEKLLSISKKTKDEKTKYFFTFINHDVPQYWRGTPWSFAGTSRDPRKGSIACGYFVTNTLSDYGFNLNRTFLARQASSVMIKKLCRDIRYFTKRQEVEKYLLGKKKNQVYIVGLDFHTGYMTRENKDTYFIHSNYVHSEGVIKELTKNSKALNASRTFMIGTLNYR